MFEKLAFVNVRIVEGIMAEYLPLQDEVEMCSDKGRGGHRAIATFPRFACESSSTLLPSPFTRYTL